MKMFTLGVNLTKSALTRLTSGETAATKRKCLEGIENKMNGFVPALFSSDGSEGFRYVFDLTNSRPLTINFALTATCGNLKPLINCEIICTTSASPPVPKRGGFITHDARHTAVTRMLQAGVDLSTVGAITGHSDANLVLHYSHATRESRKKATSVLENFVTDSKKKAG